MLHNKINLSKHILHFKLSSSLKKGSTIIIWTKQIVSGHNVLQRFKTNVSYHLMVIFIHKLIEGNVPSLVAEKSVTAYCPGFSLELCHIQILFEFKILCPGTIPSPQYRKNTDKEEQVHSTGHQHSQGL